MPRAFHHVRVAANVSATMAIALFFAFLLSGPMRSIDTDASCPGGMSSWSAMWHWVPVYRPSLTGEWRLPLWNSLYGAGVPYWAAGPGGHLFAHPFVVVLPWLAPRFFFLLLWATHAMLAMTGVAKWLQMRGLPFPVALFAGLLYAANPCVARLGPVGQYGWSALASMLPWCVVFLSRLHVHPRPRLVFLALASSGSFVAMVGGWGLWMICLVSAFVLWWRESGRMGRDATRAHARQIFAATLFPFAISALVALPHSEYLLLTRPLATLAETIPTVSWHAALSPFLATRSEPPELVFYATVVLLLLAVPLWKRPKISAVYLGRLALDVVLVALAGWLAGLSFERMDLRSAARWAQLALAVFLSLTLAVGLARCFWHYICHRRDETLGAAKIVFLLSNGFLVAIALGRWLPASLAGPWFSSSGASHMLRQALCGYSLALLLFGLARGTHVRTIMGAAMLLVLVDAASVVKALSWDPTVQKNLTLDSSSWRALFAADSDSRFFVSPRSQWATLPLLASGLPVFSQLGCRQPPGLARVNEVLRKRLGDGQSAAAAGANDPGAWRYLSLVGVRWVFAPRSQWPPETTPYLSVTSFPDSTLLYRLTPAPCRVQVWQRAAWAISPQQALAATLADDWNGDTLFVEGVRASDELPVGPKGPVASGPLRWDVGTDLAADVFAPAAAMAVFADVWYPGWRAWVEDKPVPIYRANGWMRALPIPAGKSLLRTVYDPFSFRLGAFLSCLGLLGVTTWAASPRWLRQAHPSPRGRRAERGLTFVPPHLAKP